MRNSSKHWANAEVEHNSEAASVQEHHPVSEDLSAGTSQKNYSLATLAVLFLIMSIFGWFLEILLYLVRDGVLINPGILHGPWIPIYGVAALSVLLLLNGQKKNPLATFFFIMVICGTVEFVTGYVLETIVGAKWWDYSSFVFNLWGYVCLEALLLFGVIGLVFVYKLAPACDRWLSQVHERVLKYVLIFMLSLFALDTAFSFISPNYAAVEFNRLEVTESQTVSLDIINNGEAGQVITAQPHPKLITG